MSKPVSVFDEPDDDAIPVLKPKPETPEAARDDVLAEARSAEMRAMAKSSGYAGQDSGITKKTVYDYTADDHRRAPRKTKTFTTNPETVLQCFHEFCKTLQVGDKAAFYEALQLLGEKYNFAPLANIPSWDELKTRSNGVDFYKGDR